MASCFCAFATSAGVAELGWVPDWAGTSRCSETFLPSARLYAVAPSKEQLVLAVVRHFFRRATERIEPVVRAEPDAGRRLGAYLAAVARELEPASEAFRVDLAAHPPAEEVYRANTARAARRVQQLVDDGVRARAMRPVDARFVGAAVAEVMSGIQQGVLRERTGMSDATAYAALADLVTRGVDTRA